MKPGSTYTFKMAREDREFEQIYKLNYRTFVEEIPQHEPNPEKRLIDKFHNENTYMICLYGDRLVGMVTIRSKRPFSLDEKLNNLDTYLPKVNSICEIRLLAIDKDYRSNRILTGLLQLLTEYYDENGYDLVIVSAATRQLKLYKHIAFTPFGPLVGTPNARFQPMYLTDQRVKALKVYLNKLSGTKPEEEMQGNFLPGPVNVSKEVRRAFMRPAVSHRSPKFIADFQKTKELLSRLVNAQHVEIVSGSGTLANDMIAAQLSLNPDRGLILSNGEFGDRLIDHATRFGLSFQVITTEWGHAFNLETIKEAIEKDKGLGWLWVVHCETSTGILNNLEKLKRICTGRGIRLCADCISSIGTVPVDLQDVYLASGVSGKGVGAFSGLSMVFYDHDVLPSPVFITRYLDLGLYAISEGIPFTISSNLVYALKTALEHYQPDKILGITELSTWVKANLREMGFSIVGLEVYLSPAVITVALPPEMSSESLGSYLDETGYTLSYRSKYLLEKNWVQICLMGECSREVIKPLLQTLQQYLDMVR